MSETLRYLAKTAGPIEMQAVARNFEVGVLNAPLGVLNADATFSNEKHVQYGIGISFGLSILVF